MTLNIPPTLAIGVNYWPDAAPAAQLHRREAHHAALLALNRAALEGDLSLDRLLEQAVDLVAKTLQVEFCKVLELLPGSDMLRLRVGVGWDPGLVGDQLVATGSGSQAGVTLAANDPVIVVDLQRDDRVSGPKLLLDHHIRSGLSCVIRGRDGLAWGVIGAHTRRLRRFAADEADFLQSVADTLGALFQREQAEARARWQERQFRVVVNALPVLIAYITPDLVYRYANATYEDWLGVSPNCVVGRTMRQVLGDATFSRAKAHVDAVVRGEPRSYDNRLEPPGRPARMVQVSLIPDAADDGHVHGFFAMAFDITERQEREEQVRLIAGELNHRVKNMLARVQSITRQTARKSISIDDFMGGFLPRLRSLGTANELLTRGDWTGAGLHDVVATAARSAGADPGAVHISGPTVHLSPRAVLALHLVFHEMFTNAIKYGALCAVTGQVRVRWEYINTLRASRDNGPREREIRIEWCERGGLAPQLPTTCGFGSYVIQRSIEYDLKGTSRMEFGDAEGLSAEFRFPLPADQFRPLFLENDAELLAEPYDLSLLSDTTKSPPGTRADGFREEGPQTHTPRADENLRL